MGECLLLVSNLLLIYSSQAFYVLISVFNIFHLNAYCSLASIEPLNIYLFCLFILLFEDSPGCPGAV